MSRIQMLNYNKRHSGVRRHVVKELLERLKPACRSAHAYDGKTDFRDFLVPGGYGLGWLGGLTISFEPLGLVFFF